MLAVIKTGGKQYLVKKGERIKIEKLPQKEGETVEFKEVLLLGDKIGQPYIKGAKVVGKVLKQGKDKKIIVEKFKSKVRYHKKHGHRQPFSLVEISNLEG